MQRILYEQPEGEVDLESAYEMQGDYLPHILNNGVSGSGKSTFLVNLALRYIERGYTVIWREMGKYDILTRFMNIQDIIDWYESEHYTGDNREKFIKYWNKYEKKYGNPFLVISSVEEIQSNKINLIVWDIIKECSSGEVLIHQYYTFFKILREKRELSWDQDDLIVILDEANHLIPTMIKNPHKNVSKQIIEQTWWLSQWRGFHVRFVLSTHSTRQINLDARLQCQIYFFKQSDRKDIKDLMSHELFYLEQDEFMDVYQRFQSLAVNEVLYIDAQRRYKIFKVPWIPKKYGLNKILEFIRSYDPKPIINPIDFSWQGAKKIAENLYLEMSDRDYNRVFFTEEKTNFIRIKVKIHQLWNFLFRHVELRMLYGHYDFLDSIAKAILCLYEDQYRSQVEREYQIMLENVLEIVDSDLTVQSKVYEIKLKHPRASARQLAAWLDISDNKANKYCWQVDLERKRNELLKKGKAVAHIIT